MCDWQSYGGGNRQEAPANQSTTKKLVAMVYGGEAVFLLRNHGNQTRSLHKLFSFFDLVKAGVHINMPTFPYQRC